MIIVYHNKTKVLRIEGAEISDQNNFSSIGETLFSLALQYPEEVLVWCNVKWEHSLNIDKIELILHHKKMMVSYHPYSSNTINTGIGYVDNASILVINKEVPFFTWQMSSEVGAAHAILINTISCQIINKKENFDYLLNSMAKRAMPMGLFCYSEPSLLQVEIKNIESRENNDFVLFKFVKQHYNIKWIVILFISFAIYEKKLKVFPIINSLFYKRRDWEKDILDPIKVQSNKIVVSSKEIDVIIPTIGRATYLRAVLNDLRMQTHLPKKVIIIEQNPLSESVSELDFINTESWPFKIEHIFTHQAGACNARNIALSKVTSEWVFLNDDDNKIENNVIENAFENIIKYGLEAIVTDYPQVLEKNDYDKIHQTTIFGSGNSFIRSKYLNLIRFNLKYEFGYGEDFDFGMQLRNIGIDVLFFPEPAILHLKAQVGGFRIKPNFAWSNDQVIPMPSPTVMLNNLKYKTQQQLSGYKTVYFYNLFSTKWNQNPYRFYKRTNAHWKASLYWAKKLKAND